IRLSWHAFVGDDPQARRKNKDFAGEKSIADFVAALEFDEKRGAVATEADFHLGIEVRKGEKTLTKLGFSGPWLIRWNDGAWKGDGVLTREGSRKLCQWLEAHGLPEWERERRAIQAEVESNRRRFEGLLAAFPKECEAVLKKPLRPKALFHEGSEEDVKEHADELQKLTKTKASLAACVFRAYRDDDRELGFYDIYDILLASLLKRCSPADVFAGLKELKGDAKSLAGSSRFMLGDYYGAIPTAERDEWTLRICRAALAEAPFSARSRALSVLAGNKSDSALEVLRDAGAGKGMGKAAELESRRPHEPGLAAQAGFWLGVRKDAASIPLLRAAQKGTRDSDRTVWRLALQMSGAEKIALEPKDYETDSVFRAEAVSRAAARLGGREGMDFLVKHGLGHRAYFVNAAAAQGVRVVAQRDFPTGPAPPAGERAFDELAKWWSAHPANKPQSKP
ncbi:MAG TPA: hypothetical protein VNC50_07755, partial [Planctomycetia bacterium]|nr:hypothetical protein [Planctomycetia bacterium]